MKFSLSSLSGIFVSQWDSIRGSYWFIPMVMSVLAVVLAFTLIELDRHVDSAVTRRWILINDAGAEGTRALLSTVAGSMITVTGVVFSITIVALTLASSQFGPRLLRNFLRDRRTQLVLGAFVATFLYSVLVLRSVESERVPHLAATGSVVLTITSVFVLIYYVHHAASSIQASNVIAGVVADIDDALPHLFPEMLGREPPGAVSPRAIASLRAEKAREVVADSSGYLRVIGSEPLFELSVEHDLQIEIVVRPGDYVAEGDALVRVHPAERCTDAMTGVLCDAFVIGSVRSAVQDLGFLTGQLAEMAVRALSPGINDPTTAIACVHRLGDVVARVADREMPAAERCDEDGNLRVITPPTRFSDIVASCFDPIRRYGLADPAVVESVLSALARATERSVAASRRAELLEHAEGWSDGFEQEGRRCSSRDRSLIEQAFARVEGAAATTTTDPA